MNPNSITDLLGSKGLPTDKEYRANVYQNLGLGTSEDFLKGTATGESNIKLLQHLTQNPQALDALSKAKGIVTGQKPTTPQGQPITTATPTADELMAKAKGMVATTTPAKPQTTTEDINAGQLQAKLTNDLTANTPASARDAIVSGINALQESAKKLTENYNQTSYMQQFQDFQTQLGIPAAQQRILDIETVMKSSKDDLAKSIAAAGGVASASQVEAISAWKNKALIDEYDALSKSVANKENLVNQYMIFSKMDREEAEKRASTVLDTQGKMIDYALKLQSLDDDSKKMMYQQIKDKEKSAMDKIDLLLKSGNLSQAPDSMIASLAMDAGLDPALVKNAARSADAQLDLKNQLKIAQMESAAYKLEAAGQKVTDAKQAAQDSALSAYSIANELSNMDYAAITGIPSLTKFIPGTGAQATLNTYNQLKSLLSVENRSKLKGSGAISDFEAKMLEKASTALSTNLSNKDFGKELSKVKGILATSAGMDANVTITDPKTGKSQDIQANREGINNALRDGLTVEYK